MDRNRFSMQPAKPPANPLALPETIPGRAWVLDCCMKGTQSKWAAIPSSGLMARLQLDRRSRLSVYDLEASVPNFWQRCGSRSLSLIAPDHQPAHMAALRGNGDHAHHEPLPPGRLGEIADGVLATEEAVMRSAIGFQGEAFEIAEMVEQQPTHLARPD